MTRRKKEKKQKKKKRKDGSMGSRVLIGEYDVVSEEGMSACW